MTTLPPTASSAPDPLLHANRLAAASLNTLFSTDAARAQRFSLRACAMLFDYSKQHLDEAARQALLDWANETHLTAKTRELFDGLPVNPSEGRAALHMLCRAPASSMGMFGASAQARLSEFCQQREAMLQLARQIRDRELVSASGLPLDQMVHVGIGGSDLGPAMVVQALQHEHTGPEVRFLSNVDGAALEHTLRGLNARRTLLAITSKTFTTLETMLNARAIIDWMAQESGCTVAQIIASQVVGITASPSTAAEFGIPANRTLCFDTTVGGRFSLWSSVGLPIAVALGPEQFEALLAGAHSVDQHVLSTKGSENLPLMMALIGCWNATFMQRRSQAVVPYAQALARLPAYLQQLEMESNGKSVEVDGTPAQSTCPVIWGEPGTNGQHAFFQMLHQGTDVIPVDFIAAREARHPFTEHHRWLLANCLAQSRALMVGADAQDPHKRILGNRPSTTLLMPRLDAHALGALIAAYEFKVIYQAMLWGINPFDQWAVELGKSIARDVETALRAPASAHGLDGSTALLLSAIHSNS